VPSRAAASEQESPPGQALGATLGLIALFFLPLLGGGYSGAGYQVGLVLLPVAAAIAWAASANRPRFALLALLLLSLSAALLPLWIHPGRLLWHYALHIPAAWAATWVLLRETPQRVKYLLPVIVVSSVLTALYGWWQVLAGGDLAQQNLGTFGLHNAYAGYLLLAWPVAALAAAQAQRAWLRGLYACAAALLALTLLFTYSRASWLVFALQVLGLGAWVVWRKMRVKGMAERLLAAGAASLALAALAVFSLPVMRHVLGTLGNAGDYSLQGRLRYWNAALQMFGDHPWFGVGLGGFAYTFPQYQQDWRYYSVDPHSWPLQLLCEMGLAGLLVAGAVLAGLAWWTRRLWRGSGGAPEALLLSLAVLGSVVHAAVDFDYTFGATTALLGALLAYGAHLASPAPADAPAAAPKRPLSERAVVALSAAALLCAAIIGQGLTLERYVLDRLRDTPGIAEESRRELLRQAQRFVPYNFRTRYQLASLMAQPGKQQNLHEAEAQLKACLKLNPKYTLAWALRGRLAGPQAGNLDLAFALDLDPYNYPEHYFIWASLAQSDAQRLERLQLGLQRIPIDDPIPPDHVRPTWYKLNPMMVQWYEEMARLATTETERQLYSHRAETFKQYWRNEQAKYGGAPVEEPPAPESSV
jgi:O-antigen ligase